MEKIFTLLSRTPEESQKGIALLIVLWVMVILMVSVFSFSLMTRAETYGTLAFKEAMEKKFLAEAGVDRGIMEIIYRSVNQSQTLVLVGKEVWKVDGTAYTTETVGGGYVVRLIDESGKISLTGLTDQNGIILKNILINQGSSPENADIIVDSILDWQDADDLRRLNGAEGDYYMSLPNPYKARNADIETPEELILVKGVTPEILYGTGKVKGIIRYLTIYSKTGMININAAPKEVLTAIPGMNVDMVDQIISFRASAEINSLEDIKNIIGASYSQMAPYISFGPGSSSGVYTVEATGYKGPQKRGYSILATVIFDSPQKYRYVYYKTPVEIIQ
jgi:general secretion pathway protein K